MCSPTHATHTHTQSGNLPLHTQQYAFCLSICPSINLSQSLCIHQLLWLLCPYIASRFSLLLFLYPSCSAYHIPTVSLPINAHRAALQWGWRVPRQQAQYRVYRHACTCQPGRVRGRGGAEWGIRWRGRGGRKSKGEWMENMSSQADRTAVCHTAHIHRHTAACSCKCMQCWMYEYKSNKQTCTCTRWGCTGMHIHQYSKPHTPLCTCKLQPPLLPALYKDFAHCW